MTASPSHVLIVGAAGFTNLGDDAILAAMLSELRDALPDAEFTVAGGSPELINETHGVSAISVRDVRALDAAVAQARLAIIGGGGFIYDYDGIISPYDFFQGAQTFMYPYYRAALSASIRDVPLLFYAIGVDSLVTPVGRALTRDVLSLATAITVRDPISLLDLRRAGVRCPRVEVTADPAIRIEPPAADAWAERPAGRVIAFVTRPWLRWAGRWTPSASRHYEAYGSALAAAADHVVEAWDATPVFLPGQRYNDDDLETAKAVVARMAHGGRAVVAGDVTDEEQYRAALAGADAVVSTRLHPLILGATAGVPLVGITITEKVRAFMLAVGQDEQLVSPWVASDQDLRRCLDRVLGDPEPIRRQLQEGVERQRRAAARNAEIAAEIVSGPRAGLDASETTMPRDWRSVFSPEQYIEHLESLVRLQLETIALRDQHYADVRKTAETAAEYAKSLEAERERYRNETARAMAYAESLEAERERHRDEVRRATEYAKSLEDERRLPDEERGARLEETG